MSPSNVQGRRHHYTNTTHHDLRQHLRRQLGPWLDDELAWTDASEGASTTDQGTNWLPEAPTKKRTHQFPSLARVHSYDRQHAQTMADPRL